MDGCCYLVDFHVHIMSVTWIGSREFITLDVREAILLATPYVHTMLEYRIFPLLLVDQTRKWIFQTERGGMGGI